MARRSGAGVRRAAGGRWDGKVQYRPRLTADARRRLKAHREWLTTYEPGLTLEIVAEAGSAKISGTLRVRVAAGIPRDFDLRLEYLRSREGVLNPFRPPDTYEVGGRLPYGVTDRHIEADGRFCLWHPLEEPQDYDRPEGLALHLDRVRQFLLLQLRYEHREKRGLKPYWLGPEWDHGVAGHRQWVREHAAGVPREALRPLLRIAYRVYEGRGVVSPNSPCPCRSRQLWKLCHGDWTRRLVRAMKDYPGAVVDELLNPLKDDDGPSSGTTPKPNP